MTTTEQKIRKLSRHKQIYEAALIQWPDNQTRILLIIRLVETLRQMAELRNEIQAAK